MRSRVELFEQIRRDRRLDELSIRELADRHGVHRRTVRQALDGRGPAAAEGVSGAAPPGDRSRGSTVIDAWLVADKDAPRKQRHTARRIWQRLVAEHQATLSEVTVSRYVARRRVELGLLTREVSIPQTHLAGAEAEVDFGEFYSTIAGLVVKCWMFVMRLSHSGKAFHVAFATQAQEAFLEGHVLAFEYFGGVPGRIRYDNLKPAVIRVLKGRDRTESERFTALRSHYGFDSFFCRPGIDGAHEKGGVEGEIGRFRRRHLVPVPTVASLAELNDLIATGDRLDDDRVITGRPITIGAAFATGGEHVDGGCRPRRSTAPGCCTRGSTTGPGCRCGNASTPCRPATPGDAYRSAWPPGPSRSTTGRRLVAHHERAVGRYVEVLCLDHYLEVLKTKPGGLPGATALAQAKAHGVFTALHQAYWDAARRARGDAAGTRALIAILLAHRTMPAAALIAAMDRAVASGCLDPETVLIDARRHTTPLAPVVAIGALARYDRPPPTLTDYDDLLTGSES